MGGLAESRTIADVRRSSSSRSSSGSRMSTPRIPSPRGSATDRRSLHLTHPGRDELGETRSVRRQDAERSVSSAGDLNRQIDDSLQQGGQRQLRGKCEPGLEQALSPAPADVHRSRS